LIVGFSKRALLHGDIVECTCHVTSNPKLYQSDAVAKWRRRVKGRIMTNMMRRRGIRRKTVIIRGGEESG
jgi:hypothetical protein